MHRNFFLILIAILSVTAYVSAELTVVVTPTRSEQSKNVLPAEVIVLTGEEITSIGAKSVADILRTQGGLVVEDILGDVSRVSISARGFMETAGQNTLILVDGRRLNNADLSNPELGSIALENIERIEIINGSAGVLYGNQAVGGVINIITKTPTKKAATVAIAGGSYNNRQVSASTSERRPGGLEYRVSVNARDSDNYRDNNRLEYRNLYARVGGELDNRRVRTYLEFQRNLEYLELPGALLAEEVRENRRQSISDFSGDFGDTQTGLIRFYLEADLNDQWTWITDINQEQEDRAVQQSFRNFPATETLHGKRTQHSFQPKLLGRFKIQEGEVLLTTGIDQEQVNYQAIQGPSGRRDSISAYAQSIVPLSHSTDITAGIRYLNNEDIGDNSGTISENNDHLFVGELGINHRVNPGLRLYARLDENYRLPTADEFTFIDQAETELNTQTGYSGEIGLEYSHRSLQLAVNLYRLSLQNEIAYDPTANGPFGPSFGANVNLDNTVREGGSVALSLFPQQKLELGLAYYLVNAKFESGFLKGNTVPAVPESLLKLTLISRPSLHWSFWLDGQYRSGSYLAGDYDNENEQTGGYTVFNANIRYQYGKVSYALRVNNLSNKQYVEGANVYGGQQPAPERHIWFTLSYDF